MGRHTDFTKGDKVICVNGLSYEGQLTKDKEYIALSDEEAGIFVSCPFLTVMGDNGEPATGHTTRFKLA